MKKIIIILLLLVVLLTGCLRASHGNTTERECEAYTYETETKDETSAAETDTEASKTEQTLPSTLNWLLACFQDAEAGKSVSYRYDETSKNWEYILTYKDVVVRLNYPHGFNKVTVEQGTNSIELPWTPQLSSVYFSFDLVFQDVTGDGNEELIMTTCGEEIHELFFVFDLKRWKDISPIYTKDESGVVYLKKEYTSLLLQAYQEECERCGVDFGYRDGGIININEEGEFELDTVWDAPFYMEWNSRWSCEDDGKIRLHYGSGSPIPLWNWEMVFAFTEEGCVVDSVKYTIYPEEETVEGK